jgi:hypothetical protein
LAFCSELSRDGGNDELCELLACVRAISTYLLA